jgi:hypothetical protein
MACKDCNHPDGCRWNVKEPCAVCQLLNGDNTRKRVCYCRVCDKWICSDHWNDIPARAAAMCVEQAQLVVEKAKKGAKRIRKILKIA